MGTETPRHKSSDRSRGPLAEQRLPRTERPAPLGKTPEKAPRQPGQIDIRRLPESSIQQ